MVSRDKRPGENWVKYELNVKGASGKLKAKVIGDYLTHQDLQDLEKERQLFYASTEKTKKSEADYVPVDFDSYSIPDKGAQEKGKLPNDAKIWRISSLTASVDDDTKILVLPQAESKRAVKIKDTNYVLDSFEKLLDFGSQIESGLLTEKGVIKRYEDKTQEEIHEDQVRKRKQQFGKLIKFRTYQMAGIAGALFFYLFVYRRFLHPKSITNSVVYNQAISFVKKNQKCSDVLGSNF